MSEKEINAAFEAEYKKYRDERLKELEASIDAQMPEKIKYRDIFPRKEYSLPVDRNEVLEEVAKEFDKMTALGDTAASFARYVRDMKK